MFMGLRTISDTLWIERHRPWTSAAAAFGVGGDAFPEERLLSRKILSVVGVETEETTRIATELILAVHPCIDLTEILKPEKNVCQLEVRQPFYCFQVRNWFKVRSNERRRRRRRKGKSLAPAETEKGEFVKIYASGEGRKERLNLWVSLEYQVLSPPFGRKTTTTDLSLRYCHELLSLSPKKEKGSSPHLCILLSEGEAQEVRQLILISRRKREKSK